MSCLPQVLADQNGQSAHEAEDDDLNQKDGGVGRRDGGELIVAQQAHHEGVHKAQGSGDEILQDQRQGQQEKPLVKAGFPAQIVQHTYLTWVDLRMCRLPAYSMGIRVS